MILKEILKGYYYLYKKNIIHRDLKPGNILITKDDKIKITDFGYAK
jgi:serine/threonine protein kinase